MKQKRTFLQTTLILVGLLIVTFAFFAYQIGLDHNTQWGTRRLLVFIAGIIVIICSRKTSEAMYRLIDAIRNPATIVAPLKNWIALHFTESADVSYLEKLSGQKSVIIARGIAIWYVTILGILTILTHLSLLLSISFSRYAYVILVSFILIVVGLSLRGAKSKRERSANDILPLTIILLAGGLAGGIVTLSQPLYRFGAQNLDDYYYLASPLYYIRHPEQQLSFVLHDYYSGQLPFVSASFYIAGAYQYIQAAFAFLLRVNFINFAYLFVSTISGFMFPIALYLVITKLTTETLNAAIGTVATLLIVLLLGESDRSPGSWIFSRVFQGKSVVVSTGIYLIIFFSLEYFKAQTLQNWINLALTSICLVGMSTTAIMLLPPMASILFVNYYLFIRAKLLSLSHLTVIGFKYLTSFLYLIMFTVYISFVDSTKIAAHASRAYPNTLMGNLQLFFRFAPFPTTAVVFAFFSIAAIALTHRFARKFVTGLVFLPFLILNPWVSDFLIRIYSGVYFRMFYILPLFLVIGVSTAQLFKYLQTFRKPVFASALLAYGALIIVLLIYLPTSVIATLHSFSYRFSSSESQEAKEIINITPTGLMLAPFPLSSVIFTFDPDYPQMYIRPDISELFLWKQGREEEAILRAESIAFLLGNKQEKKEQYYEAFKALIQKYPEIQIVVISQAALRSTQDTEIFIYKEGFVHKARVHEFVIFWK